MTHNRRNLLALRIAGRRVDPAVFDYAPDVEVFASGAEAAAHGLRDVERPSETARRKIDGLIKLRSQDEG